LAFPFRWPGWPRRTKKETPKKSCHFCKTDSSTASIVAYHLSQHHKQPERKRQSSQTPREKRTPMAAANMLRLITCYDQGTQPNGLVSIHPNHGAAQGNRNSNTRLKKRACNSSTISKPYCYYCTTSRRGGNKTGSAVSQLLFPSSTVEYVHLTKTTPKTVGPFVLMPSFATPTPQVYWFYVRRRWWLLDPDHCWAAASPPSSSQRSMGTHCALCARFQSSAWHAREQ
jgi:hypothetical protein